MLNNRVGVNGDKKEVNNDDDEVGTIDQMLTIDFLACLLGRDAGWENYDCFAFSFFLGKLDCTQY